MNEKNYGKIPLQIDALNRHKFPEEKPKERKEYLVHEIQYGNFSVGWWVEGCFREFIGGDNYDLNVDYWWELPQVDEC